MCQIISHFDPPFLQQNQQIGHLSEKMRLFEGLDRFAKPFGRCNFIFPVLFGDASLQHEIALPFCRFDM